MARRIKVSPRIESNDDRPYQGTVSPNNRQQYVPPSDQRYLQVDEEARPSGRGLQNSNYRKQRASEQDQQYKNAYSLKQR